jgi:hypothetical protein
MEDEDGIGPSVTGLVSIIPNPGFSSITLRMVPSLKVLAVLSSP